MGIWIWEKGDEKWFVTYRASIGIILDGVVGGQAFFVILLAGLRVQVAQRILNLPLQTYLPLASNSRVLASYLTMRKYGTRMFWPCLPAPWPVERRRPLIMSR
jgi:hypothetical protein